MMSMERRWWITAPLVWASVVAIVALVAWRVIDNAGESVLARPAGEAVTPTPSMFDATPDPSDTTPDPSDAPSPTTPGATAGSPDEPAAVRRTSTWQGEEGLLRVSCTGPDLQLDGATPQDGYEIDKNERRSGSELEVRFRSIDGDRRVEIEAACVAGVPAFAVERD
jgi:hypothetical protein